MIPNFNLTMNSDILEPKAKQPLPFPLENFDEEISKIYSDIKRIYIKLNAAEQNPINNTPARNKKLIKLKYKTKSCLNLIKEISNSCQELWY